MVYLDIDFPVLTVFQAIYGLSLTVTACWLDTGQKFKNGCPKAYFFKAYTKVKNPKVGSFLRAPEDFEGLGSLKN